MEIGLDGLPSKLSSCWGPQQSRAAKRLTSVNNFVCNDVRSIKIFNIGTLRTWWNFHILYFIVLSLLFQVTSCRIERDLWWGLLTPLGRPEGSCYTMGGWARGPQAPRHVTFSMRSISLSSSPIRWSFSSRLISAACIFLLASSMAFRKLLVSSCKRNALFSAEHVVTTNQGSNSSGPTKSSCLFRSMTQHDPGA